MMSGFGTFRTWRDVRHESAMRSILLQKSKVASARIFGETLKREAIDDSDNLSRATEVAYEFSVRRRGPSDLYTKNAPAALRIFGTFGKTTFATLSALKRTWATRFYISGDPARTLFLCVDLCVTLSGNRLGATT
jgi:hypothetical protein